MSHEGLIKKLREKAGYFDYDGRPDIACDYEQAADAIEELQARVKENNDWWTMAKTLVDMVTPKWIPVAERLPEKDGAYLICYGNGLITTDIFMTFEDGRTKWYDGGYNIGGITHWMPLPKSPKEKT